MELTYHALLRFHERVDDLTAEQAYQLLCEIVERGRAPKSTDWERYSCLPDPTSHYVVYEGLLVVLSSDKTQIVTVLTPVRAEGWRRPKLHMLRGKSVKDALAQFNQEYDANE